MINRRQFLIRSSALAGLGFAAYSSWRGFRYPPLMYVLEPDQFEHQQAGLSLHLQDAILVKQGSPLDQFQADVALRAFAPEPIIHVQLHEQQQSQRDIRLVINNVHAESTLLVEGAQLDDHQVSATNHLLVLKKTARDSANITLRFQFPRPEAYRFAAIGDTGGDKELYWCLKRMAGKGADFILHLGDFVYQEGDYQRAIDYFYNTRVPCYISIGNHDFHRDGQIFQPYLDYLGVFNYAFQLGHTRFVNIDSANDFFPPWAGQRGQLMQAIARPDIIQSQGVQETIAFSHRPLKDYRMNGDHDINGVHEAKWLHKQLLAAQASHFFAGHIHDRHELDHQGIKQIIAGQGLGHQDLLLGRKVSEFVLADVSLGKRMDYSWQGLIMPTKLHCNSVHLRYLESEGQIHTLEHLNRHGRLCDNLRQQSTKL